MDFAVNVHPDPRPRPRTSCFVWLAYAGCICSLPIAVVVTTVVWPHAVVWGIAVWRIAAFVAGTLTIVPVSRGIISSLCVYQCYYVMECKESWTRLVTACLDTALLIALFYGVRDMYAIAFLARFLLCVDLFCAVDVARGVVATAITFRCYERARFDGLDAVFRMDFLLARLRGSALRLEEHPRPLVWACLKALQEYVLNALTPTFAVATNTRALTDLIMTLSADGRALTADDCVKAIGAAEGLEAFRLFSSKGNRRVTPRELDSVIEHVHAARTNLAKTLRDTHSIIRALSDVIGIVLHSSMMFVYMYIYGVDITRIWLSFSSVLFAFSFVFGGSLKMIFENIVFLFVTHPYNVGDVLEVAGQTYVVDEIRLMTSTLRSSEGSIEYHPTHKLSSSALTNLSRSGNRRETYAVYVDAGDTCALDTIREAVSQVLNEHPQQFVGAPSCVLSGCHDPAKFCITVTVEYARTGADIGPIAIGRDEVLRALSGALAESVALQMPQNDADLPK